jgi:hypothetical protein
MHRIFRTFPHLTVFCFSIVSLGIASGQPPVARPLIDTSVPAATQDKPQCKLWFAYGRWWAWLPQLDGSAIYERGSRGWLRLQHLDRFLKGLPGQADVLLVGDRVRAALVGRDRLAVAELVYDPGADSYRSGELRTEFSFEDATVGSRDTSLESATLCEDRLGNWWVAYDRNRKIFVNRIPSPGKSWSKPFLIADGIHPDDICSLYSLEDRIGVIWSDQERDVVCVREHLHVSASDDWMPESYVAKGGRTADDHLHCAVDRQGRVFVASKNSVDREGWPQHVLRVRGSDGGWANFEYANLTKTVSPTRPICVVGAEAGQLWLLHTAGSKGASGPESRIVGMLVETEKIDLNRNDFDVLNAIHPVNNVTGPRHPFPKEAPWIILASDAVGQVYEADLKVISARYSDDRP